MPKKSQEPGTRFRIYLQAELEAAALYLALADVESSKERAEIFRELAAAEMRHASHWAEKLGQDPAALTPAKNNIRVKLHVWLARRFGTRAVLPWLLKGEFEDIRKYSSEPEARPIVGDERSHARTLGDLAGNGGVVNIIQSEGWHRASSAANIRASVLGFNDGVVSNFALITGVAGGTSDSKIILLAGVAGLLAGAFSMAAGEYVSVRTQRDVYEREVEIERAEIGESPEQEKEELMLIYQAKGLTREEAMVVAERIMSNHAVALDTMAREELGFDPSQMGSPWGVALSSFMAFGLGALVPVLPHMFISGNMALFVGAGLSGMVLSVVGGVLALVSNKNVLRGALRMLLIGAAAATVTFGVGRLLGVSLGGL